MFQGHSFSEEVIPRPGQTIEATYLLQPLLSFVSCVVLYFHEYRPLFMYVQEYLNLQYFTVYSLCCIMLCSCWFNRLVDWYFCLNVASSESMLVLNLLHYTILHKYTIHSSAYCCSVLTNMFLINIDNKNTGAKILHDNTDI